MVFGPTAENLIRSRGEVSSSQIVWHVCSGRLGPSYRSQPLDWRSRYQRSHDLVDYAAPFVRSEGVRVVKRPYAAS
jgi:hypothetical protein